MSFSIIWFRHNSLRVSDHSAFIEASKRKLPLVAVFIDNPSASQREPGPVQKSWIEQALRALNNDLYEKYSLRLQYHTSSPEHVFKDFLKHGPFSVYTSQMFHPLQAQEDAKLFASLREQGVAVHIYNTTTLFEQNTFEKTKPSGYKIFTGYWNACLKKPLHSSNPEEPQAITPFELGSSQKHGIPEREPTSLAKPPFLEISEYGGHKELKAFIRNRLESYETERNYPAKNGTSLLSAYLATGQISPRTIWDAVQTSAHIPPSRKAQFLAELGWREFAYHLLHYNPEMATQPLREAFTKFPWSYNKEHLECWKSGTTGYPIVDAGMRQLKQTGWMHNRVRMIVASFLVKNLRIPWQDGEQWFWNSLIDADVASNPMNWQWVAGCGTDAAPYFRIFNPILQGEKFDPEGTYVKTFIPELKGLPKRWIHKPFKAPTHVLKDARVTLGTTYPQPIVDYEQSRKDALKGYASLKETHKKHAL